MSGPMYVPAETCCGGKLSALLAEIDELRRAFKQASTERDKALAGCKLAEKERDEALAEAARWVALLKKREAALETIRTLAGG